VNLFIALMTEKLKLTGQNLGHAEFSTADSNFDRNLFIVIDGDELERF
jgi:hypothetical protein